MNSSLLCLQFLHSGSLFSTGNNRIVIGYGGRRWIPIADLNEILYRHPLFYFPDFFLKMESPWFIQENTFECHYDELIDLLKTFAASSLPPATLPLIWNNGYKSHFANVFADLQSHFASQTLLKAVPFVFETCPQRMDLSLLAHTLINLLQRCHSKAIHPYGFWDHHVGCGILGGTPETLFTLEDNGHYQLKTMACAGTRRVACNDDGSKGQEFDFLLRELYHDAKELHEHHLVVEGIINALVPYGKVSVGHLGHLSFPGLIHLVTPIEMQMPNEVTKAARGRLHDHYDAIVRSLHPTPALGAFPKEAGARWIADYETKIKRRRFGAPVGMIDKKDRDNGDNGDIAQCRVAIRNVQWDDSGLAIGAGCGVVSASQCDREWQEICAKIASTKRLLAL